MTPTIQIKKKYLAFDNTQLPKKTFLEKEAAENTTLCMGEAAQKVAHKNGVLKFGRRWIVLEGLFTVCVMKVCDVIPQMLWSLANYLWLASKVGSRRPLEGHAHHSLPHNQEPHQAYGWHECGVSSVCRLSCR